MLLIENNAHLIQKEIQPVRQCERFRSQLREERILVGENRKICILKFQILLLIKFGVFARHGEQLNQNMSTKAFALAKTKNSLNL